MTRTDPSSFDPAPARSVASDRHRRALSRIFQAAIDAVHGETLIRARSRLEQDVWVYEHGGETVRWPLDPRGRVVAVGAGKAAASLLAGLEAVLGDRLDGGCAVVKRGHQIPLRTVALVEAGHPIPDADGVAATAQILDMVGGLGQHDTVFVVLTGGASALLVAPVDGVTMDEKARVSEVLIACGANIAEINTVRKRLSSVKGGGLLGAITPARCMTLIVSDVPGNDVAIVGSGPTIPGAVTGTEALAVLEKYGVVDRMPASVLAALGRDDDPAAAPTTEHRHIVLADSQTALLAAQSCASEMGYVTRVLDGHLEGGTHEAAEAFAAAMRRAAGGRGLPIALFAAGETTLAVTGNGRGGRNQEFAMVAAIALDGIDGIALLSSGTDGTDGPTEAAGAFADGTTLRRARALGLETDALLADNDSNGFFAALGDLHITGPTGTNVMDIIIGLID